MKLVFIIVFLCFFYPLFCVTFKSSQYGLKQGIHSTFHLSERRCYGTIHRTGHMSRRGSQRMPMRWFQSERHYLKAFPLASISTGDHRWGDYLGDGAKQQQSSKIRVFVCLCVLFSLCLLFCPLCGSCVFLSLGVFFGFGFVVFSCAVSCVLMDFRLPS